MRRSFKLATVFTGVAAVTGGFGPAAFAAPAQPDTIGNQECLANQPPVNKWVHLYYPNNDHPAECFHGQGKTPAGGEIYSFCPGNNSGEFWGLVAGQKADFSYHSGQARAQIRFYNGTDGGQEELQQISINGWSGYGLGGNCN